jgi:selenocysteine lyase/cysteine desulfurase
MDVARVRRQFPVTDRMVFLNNAAESPLNLPVRRRLDEYLDLAAWSPDTRPPARHPLRPLLSRLLGGAPEEYALVTSTGVGLGLAAAGYAWAPGDNVVVPADEHWNNTFPWLALRARGVDVRLVPLNVDDDGIDVLACAGFKWLLGLHGTGFVYVRKGVWDRIQPVLPGMFAAEDNLHELLWLPNAQRYETGSLAYSLFYAWTAGQCRVSPAFYNTEEEIDRLLHALG